MQDVMIGRAVAFSAAANGVLDQRTAAALQPALDQIGAVFDEVMICQQYQTCCKRVPTVMFLLAKGGGRTAAPR